MLKYMVLSEGPGSFQTRKGGLEGVRFGAWTGWMYRQRVMGVVSGRGEGAGRGLWALSSSRLEALPAARLGMMGAEGPDMQRASRSGDELCWLGTMEAAVNPIGRALGGSL